MSRIEKFKMEKIVMMALITFFFIMIYLLGNSIGWRFILYMGLTLYSSNQITRWFTR